MPPTTSRGGLRKFWVNICHPGPGYIKHLKISASFLQLVIPKNFLSLSLGSLSFSNSLIIHQEKTKKIITVAVVWICVPNYHKILPTLALNFSENY